MADIRISDVITEIDKYKFNPAMIQRTALEVLRKASDNTINLVDPTNPFVFALENSAVNTAVFMQQNEASTRRLYPSAAIDAEDLYLHMSDKDYVDRFAKPATAKFTILMDKKELLNVLVLDPATGIKKITIPRNSTFTVASIPFSLQYPIDIRLLTHGGLQIVYINDKESPLQSLSTNTIDWYQMKDPDGNEYVKFDVEATQFKIETSYNDITTASGLKTDITIEDSFYYVRCYIQDDAGVYKEILTTHTQQIYDPSTVTAVIKVIDKKIRVVIPVIYATSGLAKGKLRIDVYQTKGYLNMLLGNYKLDEFVGNWINVDKADDTVYTTPIRNFKTLAIYSSTHVNAGRDALTFAELKDRVIKNSVGKQNLPITTVQLQSAMTDYGYDIVKNVDTITNRIFLATKALPNSSDNKILTAAASAMATITTSLREASDAYGAKNNGTSVTLTSKAVYQNKNGITKPISQLEFSILNNLPILQRCQEITTGNYFYSPFSYVLNATKDTFEVRPYYLDGPVIETKNFESENPTTGLRVSIAAAYSVQKTDTGYLLNIVTDSSDVFKALDDNKIHVQLAFKSKNQNNKVYLLGNLIGKNSNKERLYQFNLGSNFNIDNDDFIEFTSFEGQTNGLSIKSYLIQDIDIFFTTNETMGSEWTSGVIDNQIGKFQLPEGTVGITHEILTVRFGYALKNLWSQSRSVVSSVPYQVYPTDVLAYYKADVYESDPVTGAHFSVDQTGKLVYNLLHSKGDPILDSNGHQRIDHHKGELIYDELGNPLPMEGYEKEMVRIVDILMIEGVYYFATDSVVANYRSIVTSSLLDWVTNDLPKYQSNLLDQTKIFFYPKVNSGDIKIITSGNEIITTPAGQALKIILHVPPKTYNDETLKAALEKASIISIATSLQNQTVSNSEIESALRAIYKTDVIDVEVSGLGGATPQSTFSVYDNSNRCSIRKRLTALPDNQLIVEEDLEFSFIKHGLDN